MSNNLSVFYVTTPSSEKIEQTISDKFLIFKSGDMWLRLYKEDGSIKILKLSEDLIREGIENDEIYESLKQSQNLICLKVPKFFVFHIDSGVSEDDSGFDSIVEALNYISENSNE